MRRVFGFVLGVITGGLLGSAAVLLLTPVSGKALRGQIENRIRYLQNEIAETRNQKRAELERQLHALRAPRV